LKATDETPAGGEKAPPNGGLSETSHSRMNIVPNGHQPIRAAGFCGRARSTAMTGLLNRNYEELSGFPTFGRMFADFDRMFRELERRPYSAPQPEVRTANRDTGYEISVDLPGLTEADIKLEIHRGVLTLSGSRANEV